MSNTEDKIWSKIKIFFQHIPWKKILTFSFFVILASIFWIIQVYRQKFETTLVIPIKYTNIPDSIIFENELPTEVNARIKDDGASLFKYYLLKRNDSLEINVRNLIKESNNSVIQGTSFGQMIRGKLYMTSELISYSPARISYSYAILEQHKCPVIYDGYIDLPSGYIVDGDITVSPDSVMLYGSKSSLDTIAFVHTVADTIDQIISDTIINVRLKQIKGIRYNPAKVQISVPVDQFTTKTVDVPVTCINLPQNLKIKFFPSTVKISFSVGLKRFKDIDSSLFSVIVDYNEIANQKEPTVQVRIVDSPPYIRSMTPSPSEVEFVVEQE